VLDVPALTQIAFFERYLCFFNFAEYDYLEQNEPFSTMKILIFRKYFFQKITQFSQGNNMLGAAVSNIDGFLWIDTSVSSCQLNSPICIKQSLSPP
jgi:hypothetical protein